MIELRDIDTFDDAVKARDPEDQLAGFILFAPNGGWHAVRPSTGYERSGDGSLRELEPGLWVTNLPYERVTVLARGARHILLRADGWLKLSAAQILGAAGLDGVNDTIAAKYLATITNRVHMLALETVRALNPEPRAYARARGALRAKPSLATGLAQAHEAALMRGRPAEKRIATIFGQTHQMGMFCFGRKVAPEGHRNLPFRFPRLSHALSLTRAQIPGRATWQMGARKANVTSTEFIESAREMGRPLIFRASHARTGGTSEALDALIGANRSSDTYRTLFLSEELDILRQRAETSVESVVVGEEWVTPSTADLLDAMLQVCGGRAVAANSWSANLLAENILASAFRRPQGDNGAPPAETVWLAARDRVAMFPAIEAFYDFGASLVSAMHGTIMMQVPDDPELLAGIMDTAWQFGLTLPIGDNLQLAGLGVPIPVERSGFGGNSVDYGFSVIAQRAKKKALLALDDIMDAPAEERVERFRSIVG